MLSQLQRGDEPALLPCRRSGFLRRPYLRATGFKSYRGKEVPQTSACHLTDKQGSLLAPRIALELLCIAMIKK
jgi:hypothetical protein